MFLKFKEQKFISPLIATILLVVVAVILVSVLLTWGKDFAQTNISKADSIDLDQTNFVFAKYYSSRHVLVSNNSNRKLTIVAYKILPSYDNELFDYFENKIFDLKTPLVIENNVAEILGINCYPEYTFNLELITDQNQFITTKVSANNMNDVDLLNCGLMGYWPFDGDVKDHSFSGFDLATKGNPNYVDGMVGQALDFSLSSQYARNDYLFFGTNPLFTVSAWIKRTGDMSSKGLWGIGSGGSSSNTISSYNDKDNFIGIDCWGSPTFYVEKEYPLNEWVYVTWVKKDILYNLYNIEIYVNGVKEILLVSRNGSKIPNLTEGITIGAIYPSGTYSGSGIIDDFRIFDRALSEEEVYELYNKYN